MAVDFSQWPILALVLGVTVPLLAIILQLLREQITFLRDLLKERQRSDAETAATLREMTITLNRLTDRLEGGR